MQHDTDSAIGLSADRETRLKRRESEEVATADPERSLQDWILSFFGEEPEQLDLVQSEQKEPSLQEWYSGTTYFFDLGFRQDQLVPQKLEATPRLQERIKNLVPRMTIPKYIRKMNLPWTHATEITVLSEVLNPGPIRPGVVRVGEEMHFFKPVDSDQPEVTKREINILQRITKLD